MVDNFIVFKLKTINTHERYILKPLIKKNCFPKRVLCNMATSTKSVWNRI